MLKIFRPLVYFSSDLSEVERFRQMVRGFSDKVLMLPPADFSFGGGQDVPFSPDLAKLIAPAVAENAAIQVAVVQGIKLNLELLRNVKKVRLHDATEPKKQQKEADATGGVMGAEDGHEAKEVDIYVIQRGVGETLPRFTSNHAIILSEV